MFIRRTLYSGVVLGLAVISATAQDSRGRKYKAPPDTSHIEVLVLRDNNHKPIPNAAVVFHSIKDGRDEGNLEVKTNEEGKATIDVIPTGSSVDVQVIADGFATFANTYQVDEQSRAIEIRMLRPRAQVSTYTDTRGQASQRQSGIQEPAKPVAPPPSSTQPTPPTSNLNGDPDGMTVAPTKPASP